MLRIVVLLLAFVCSPLLAAPTLQASAAAKVGSELPVTVTGSSNPRDFVTIVPVDAQEGEYDAYQYVNKPSGLKLQVPSKPGNYEIRLLSADSPYPTLARRPLKVESVEASLDAPAQVSAGQAFQVKWTGPDNARDYIGIGDADPKKRQYISYVYTSRGSPITLDAPDEAGEYELRYFLAVGNEVIARKRITVGGVNASIKAPAQVRAGTTFDVTWEGPNNARDFITVIEATAPDKRYDHYQYTSKGSPLKLRAPDKAGEYEVRYLTAQSYATLAKAKVTVTPNTAAVQGPAEAVAGAPFAVKWSGPNNDRDYITLVPKGAREGVSGNYTYTSKGNPLNIVAPLEPGEYELRYSTAQSHATLARQAVRITPAQQAPGFIRVTKAASRKAAAVEIILDASGSMLQRIGSQRRIDIAKQTLTQLTAKAIPSGTPFALRVFGREEDSCQTDLEIALSALDANAVATKIGSLQAKNNARTPIGGSIEKVSEDLASATGERTVIVLTDGEETCGGDPAAAIQKLRASGTQTRVSIVGFAIDDTALEASFRQWSDLGGGAYFSAKDANGLNTAMTSALQPAFEVVSSSGQVLAEGVVGGEQVKVPAGNVQVRLKGSTAKPSSVVVKPTEVTSLEL